MNVRLVVNGFVTFVTEKDGSATLLISPVGKPPRLTAEQRELWAAFQASERSACSGKPGTQAPIESMAWRNRSVRQATQRPKVSARRQPTQLTSTPSGARPRKGHARSAATTRPGGRLSSSTVTRGRSRPRA